MGAGAAPLSALLLDTHAWIWLAAGDARMAKHERTLNRAAEAGELLLSAISIYEAALIGGETDGGRRRGKQTVRMRPTVHQWIRDAIRGTRITPVALAADTALEGAMLHAMHPDPFDLSSSRPPRARTHVSSLQTRRSSRSPGAPASRSSSYRL
jgi:PIN domain nuclease of toxin-antitoxin system